MTTAKELLDAATPLPWTYRAVADAYLYGDGDFPPSPNNLDLAVYAVNRLPRSVKIEDALLKATGFFSWGGDSWIHEDDEGTVMERDDALDDALARLRSEVPA